MVPPSTTSRAMSASGRLSVYAVARSRATALSMVACSCSDTMPVATRSRPDRRSVPNRSVPCRDCRRSRPALLSTMYRAGWAAWPARVRSVPRRSVGVAGRCPAGNRRVQRCAVAQPIGSTHGSMCCVSLVAACQAKGACTVRPWFDGFQGRLDEPTTGPETQVLPQVRRWTWVSEEWRRRGQR